MAEFLSASWIAELDAAARAADALTVAGAPLVVEQVVRGLPDGDVRYRVRVGSDGARVLGDAAGLDGDPDVILLTDYPTARALHEGRVRAQDALATGQLKVQGRPEVLAKRADLLARLDAAFVPVRARTTFPDGR
jgi:SCP-2 sterol transfer family